MVGTTLPTPLTLGIKLPRHVAIIMDGNGRWALSRRLPRVRGHQAGVKAIRDVALAAAEWGIEVLTFYAFSVDNWKRPRQEVEYLMKLLPRFLKRERKRLVANEVRFLALGELEGLPPRVGRLLAETMEETRAGRKLTLCLALNYGAQQEILQAVRKIASRVAAGEISVAAITPQLFADHLYTASLPPPDLIIRTAGELRLSNFLLYQASYAEIWGSEIFWPDFRREHLLQALIDYNQRQRKFGGLSSRRGEL